MTRREEVEALLRSGAKTIGVMMAAYSLDAVDHASQQGRTLDYSVGSLSDVEAILGALHRELPPPAVRKQSGPSDDVIETIAKMYGGYLGEVMRLEWREGEWIVPDSGPFANALCLHYGKDSLVSPPSKCYKRIVDGPEDSIVYYFQVFSDRRKGP